MPKLTPLEQQHKKQRHSLLVLCNRISSAFNFKQIPTWGDVFKMEGMSSTEIQNAFPEEQHKAVMWPELKKHLEELKMRLELEIGRSVNGEIKPAEKDESPLATVSISDAISEAENDGNKADPVVAPMPPAAAFKEQNKEPTEALTSDNDYGLHPSPNEIAFHFWFQKKLIKEIWDGIIVHDMHGQLILSSTGTGKTFMAAGLIRRLLDIKFADDKTYGHVKYLYVTRASIVEQTKRVFKKFYNIGIRDSVEILNIEQLRSRAGQLWIKEEIKIIGGEEAVEYKWRKMVNPVVILWDECQALKNPGSIQHQIGASANDIESDIYQVFISATPFTRVSEAKCFAVSTRKDISKMLGLPHGAQLSNSTWPTYASSIAYPSPPTDYNEAAVERLTKDLDPYIKRVRGVRPQFDAINGIEMIHFETKEEEKYYLDTEERYMRKKAKLQEDIDSGKLSGGGIWPLVLLNERCMAAELCRAPHIAKKMFHAVQEGYAAVSADKYKATIIKAVQILIEKYGVSRDQISLIWGGGQTKLTKKQSTALEIQGKAEKLADAGYTVDQIMKMLDITEEDLVAAMAREEALENIDPAMRLGPQSPEERQSEIDRFQSGKTLYCFYTFKAGGVGLSLHHTDEFTREKVRHKPNGYAVIEDIPNIPVRPRINFVAPTYSAIELVQGLGRCPRLTSLSNTIQRLIFYANTVETDVARIVSAKLRCLSKVVRMREAWNDIIVGSAKVEDHISNTKDMIDNPDELTGADEEEDE